MSKEYKAKVAKDRQKENEKNGPIDMNTDITRF